MACDESQRETQYIYGINVHGGGRAVKENRSQDAQGRGDNEEEAENIDLSDNVTFLGYSHSRCARSTSGLKWGCRSLTGAPQGSGMCRRSFLPKASLVKTPPLAPAGPEESR